MKILLVEDDADLASRLTRSLHDEAFAVDLARGGVDALHLGLTGPYACAILDLGLPGMDGIAVLQQWRASEINVPVLVLTSRYSWADKSAAFLAGADDYMVKPFLAQELVFRLRALIRRGQGGQSAIIRCGALEYNQLAWSFTLAGEPLRLTAFETRILTKLVQHPESPVDRETLLESVYETDSDIPFNSIEVMIGRLRRKIGAHMIETVRGHGYRLTAGRM